MDNVGPFDRSKPLRRTRARAGRRHRVDGALLPEHARDRARARRRGPRLRGRRDQVLRALHVDREAINDKGLWDEDDGFYYDQVRGPATGVWPVRTRSMTGLIPLCAVAIGPGGCRAASGVLGARQDFLRVTPQYAGVVAPSPTGDRRRWSRSSGATGSRGCSSASATSRSSCRPTGVRSRVGGLPRSIRSSSGRTASGGHGRLRAGRVDHGAVRRQLELARADLVPGQLPGDRGARALPARLGTSSRSSTRTDRAASGSWPRSPPTCPAAGQHLPPRRRRPPAVFGERA